MTRKPSKEELQRVESNLKQLDQYRLGAAAILSIMLVVLATDEFTFVADEVEIMVTLFLFPVTTLLFFSQILYEISWRRYKDFLELDESEKR